jgi:hypothetical protein
MRNVALVLVLLGLTTAGCGGGRQTSAPTTSATSVSSAPASSPPPADLAAQVLPPPLGYTTVTDASAPTGGINATKFDALIGAGAATTLGYRDGIGETYQETATGYSLQLDLFRFTADTGAADFATTAEKGVVGDASPAPAVSPLTGVPKAIAVTPTGKDANGHATYGVIAVKGTVVAVIDLAADLDSTHAAAVAALARQQYARLR